MRKMRLARMATYIGVGVLSILSMSHSAFATTFLPSSDNVSNPTYPCTSGGSSYRIDEYLGGNFASSINSSLGCSLYNFNLHYLTGIVIVYSSFNSASFLGGYYEHEIWYFNGSNWISVPYSIYAGCLGVLQESILSVSPPLSSTTPIGVQNLGVNFCNNDTLGYSLIHWRLFNLDASASSSPGNLFDYYAVPIASGYNSVSTTTGYLYNGQYSGYVELLSSSSPIISASLNFIVGTSYSSQLASYNASSSWNSTSTMGFCGDSNATGIQQVIGVLFCPSPGSISQFATLFDALKSKPPFGYSVAVRGILSTATTSGTSSITILSQYSLVSSIFDPIKNGLAFILWIAFLVYLWFRFKHLDL